MSDKKGTILIVDDEKLNRVLLSTNLVEAGYDTIMADTGKQALGIIKAEEPDVILLDLIMPEMDGFEVLEHLKMDTKLRNIPVIIVSAANEMEDVVKCIELGAEDHLSKPFEPVLLQARIKACFDRIHWLKLEKELNKKLVNKALETGRAQLSAMVLHNVGNAFTPLTGLMSSIKNLHIDKIGKFLEKCYAELVNNIEDIGHYVRSDVKGKEVFAYMNTLINSLNDAQVQQLKALNKIGGTIESISEILSIQQAYAADDDEKKEPINLNTLLNDVLQMQKIILNERKIFVEKQFCVDLPTLMIDKSRLLQALANLIKNSYEAIDELKDNNRRVISLKTFHEKGIVFLHIEDSGVGLDIKSGEDIFEFGQSTKGFSGSGLYYCKMFFEANNGGIELTSPGLGQGTLVKIWFAVDNCSVALMPGTDKTSPARRTGV
ncbi:hybrid sensor histidine kinase/response regulator [bacterium]|nr:hybrid sensor histidine kinase/response regulator [bacterium]